MGSSKEITLNPTPPHQTAAIPPPLRRIRSATRPGGTWTRTVRAPSARALTGGALVATSIVVLFGAGSGSSEVPARYLVAARDLAAGTLLTDADLASAPMDLHGDTAVHALTDPADAIGSMTIGPMSRGDLVADTRLTDAARPTSGSARILALELPVADALGGTVATTQMVDVVAVTPTDTTVLARDVLVVDATASDPAGIGGIDGVRLSLALHSEAEALDVIDARREGSIVLLRNSDAVGDPARHDVAADE